MRGSVIKERYAASYILLSGGLVSFALWLILYASPGSSGSEGWILTESLMAWTLAVFVLEMYRRKGVGKVTSIIGMSKSNSAIVWGKTLAATVGTLGLLGSSFLWSVSGGLSLQEIVFVASLNLGSLLATAGTLIPRVGNKVQGGMILGAALLILSGWVYAYSNRLELASGVSSWSWSSATFFSWIALIFVGGILVLLPWHRSTKSRVNDMQQGG